MSDYFRDFKNDPTFKPEIIWGNGNTSKPPVLVSVLGLLPNGPFLGLGSLVGHINYGETYVVELTTKDEKKVMLLDNECFCVIQESADAAHSVISKGLMVPADVSTYLEEFELQKQVIGSPTRARWLRLLGIEVDDSK